MKRGFNIIFQDLWSYKWACNAYFSYPDYREVGRGFKKKKKKKSKVREWEQRSRLMEVENRS